MEVGAAVVIGSVVAGVRDDGEVPPLGSGSGGCGHCGSVVAPSGDAAAETRQAWAPGRLSMPLRHRLGVASNALG